MTIFLYYLGWFLTITSGLWLLTAIISFFRHDQKWDFCLIVVVIWIVAILSAGIYLLRSNWI